MRTLLLIVLFGFSAVLFGQDGMVFTANNVKGSGISITWIPGTAHYAEGVQIYRKEKKGDWQPIATIAPPKVLPKIFEADQSLVTLHKTLISTPREEYVESFDAVFFAIEAIENVAFGRALKVFYDDETAQKGTTYQYKVEGKVGSEYEIIGASEPIKCEKYSPKSAPSNVELNRKKRQTSIVWNNEVDKYYKYNVYAKKQEALSWDTIMYGQSSAALTETNRDYYFTYPTDKDSTYSFRLEAIDYFGQLSEVGYHELGISDLDAPIAPNIRIFAHTTYKTVRISWDLPTDNDVVGYHIVRSTSGDESSYTRITKELIPINDTVFIDNVSDVGVYYYRLQVIDGAGNIGSSFVQIGEIHDLFAPGVPANFSAVADTGKLILSWDAVSAPDLKGYRVYRSVADDDNSDNLFVPVSTEIIDTNYYVENMAKNVRNPLVYVVTSLDSLINESVYSNMATTQLPDVTPPVAPFLKRSYEEDGALVIEWTPNVDADLAGYNLYKRKRGDTADFVQLNISLIPISINVYVDKEAKRGQFYEYYLKAKDESSLSSEPSNELSAKLNYLELDGVIPISKSRFNANKREVQIAWDADSLFNEPVVGMAVYRSLNGSKFLPQTKVNNTAEFKEKINNPGTYMYQIRAYGERGGVIQSEDIEINFNK